MPKVEKMLRCNKCQKIFSFDDKYDYCPKCGQPTGREVEIIYPYGIPTFFFNERIVRYSPQFADPVIVKKYPFGIKKVLHTIP